MTDCTLALSPIRDTLIEGFSHFATSMTAPIASGCSGCRWDLHPLESAAFARRTPGTDIGAAIRSSRRRGACHFSPNRWTFAGPGPTSIQWRGCPYSTAWSSEPQLDGQPSASVMRRSDRLASLAQSQPPDLHGGAAAVTATARLGSRRRWRRPMYFRT